MRNRIHLMILIVGLWTTSLLSAEKPDLSKQIDELLSKKTPPGDVAIIETKASAFPKIESITYKAVAFEISGKNAERIKLLEKIIEGKREFANQQRFLACSLADAYVCSAAYNKAKEIIGMFSENKLEDIDKADITITYFKMAINEQHLTEAKNILRTAEALLHKAVPEEAYKTWRSKIVERRLVQLKGELDRLLAEELGGAAYLLWLQADRSGNCDAYKEVVKTYPTTIFADASTLSLAEILMNTGDTEQSIAALDNEQLQIGALAVPCQILIGDLLIRSGKSIKSARKAYEKALNLLENPVRPAGITERLTCSLIPQQPLHGFGGWHYPEWRTRPAGSILAPGLSAQIASYWRYQIVMRLAILAYIDGKKADATTLAKSLVMFDDVDREMERIGEGPGGLILARTMETGWFMIKLDCTKGAPDKILPMITMAVGAYQIYDWAQAVSWLNCALRDKTFASSISRDFCTSLLACSEQMLGHYDKAMQIAQSIKLQEKAPLNPPWIRSRHVIFDIYMKDREQYPLAIATMQDILDNVPKNTVYAQDAMLRQGILSIGYDLPQAKKIFLAFKKRYPNEYQSAMKYYLNEIERRLSEEKK